MKGDTFRSIIYCQALGELERELQKSERVHFFQRTERELLNLMN